MTDYFEVLDEPRRLWLDTDCLKRKFLARSAQFHPDKISGDGAERADSTGRFAELNAAYQCLADPKCRLLHLLEIVTGGRPGEIQQIPNPLADLFAEVASVCRGADAFLAQKSGSPLLQAQRLERAPEWDDRLNLMKNKLGVLRQQLDDGLKSLDTAWSGSDAAARKELLPAVEEFYRRFGYLNRWNNQIQERLAQLVL